MYNITLIGTLHHENGQCNADELYKILEGINPEVIFDELPPDEFQRFYSDLFDINYANRVLINRQLPKLPLEVICVRKYMQNHNIKVFPVDIDVREKLSKYQEEISFMFKTFWENNDYNKLENEKENLIKQKGFTYLNSDKFLDFLWKKKAIEKNIMESNIQKNSLLDIYKLFHAEQIDNRENAMLENIYNYSKNRQYNRGVFLIGAEHRNSIMQKITQHEKLAEVKLNWTFYSQIKI